MPGILALLPHQLSWYGAAAYLAQQNCPTSVEPPSPKQAQKMRKPGIAFGPVNSFLVRFPAPLVK